MTHRRAFLTTLGAAVAFRPAGVLAHAPAKPPRICWLTSSVLHTRIVDAFRREMQALGYREISLEAEGKMDQLPALAAELAALAPDVIVTDGGPAVVAARRATGTVPIVIGAAAIDLVQQAVLASLARVAVVWNPRNDANMHKVTSLEAPAAPSASSSRSSRPATSRISSGHSPAAAGGAWTRC